MRRLDLVPDCAGCAAVCCVATSFDTSEDFAFDKPAGAACRYLQPSCRCAVHDQLVERGLRGCAIYDCFGAGPRVTRAFAGRSDCERERNEAFLILRVVHEQLWLLTEASRLCRCIDGRLASDLASDLAREIDRAIDALDAIATLPPRELLAVDPEPQVARARAVLRRIGDAMGGRARGARLRVVAA